MSLLDNIKKTTKMKNLQAEEKVVHTQKIELRAKLEPLQEKKEELVVQIDTTKACLKHIGLEGGEIVRMPITV
jgi:predicted  nucleic acid-binding Zn-ribbon protein